MKEVYIFLLENYVGTLLEEDSGYLSFHYSEEWLHNPVAYCISLSLPLSHRVYSDQETRAFFSALLPDDRVRTKIAQELGISSENDFALLEILGGDCAGSVSLQKNLKLKTANKKAKELNEQQIQNILGLLKTKPLLTKFGIRLSLAGAQSKIALLFKNRKFYLPGSHDITTHIIKPNIEGFQDSVYNEYFCMKLAQLCELNVADVELKNSESNPYLIITRYDRHRAGNGRLSRIHQEDFCQAMGILPTKKYQKEGGPGVKACVTLLDKYASQPAHDKLHFIDSFLFNFFIGNNDAHAKNFSLIHNATGVHLAPLYDILSTEIYTKLSREMAMKFGSKYQAHKINAFDINHCAEDLGIKPKFFISRIKHMKALISKHIYELVGDTEIKDKIITVFNKRAVML
jgi:serine/threonine-protein kinase HipA